MRSVEERVASLETTRDHTQETLETLESEVRGIGENLASLRTELAVIVSQRDEAKKSRDRWKNWWLGISSSLAVTLIVTLIAFAWRIQSNRLAP